MALPLILCSFFSSRQAVAQCSGTIQTQTYTTSLSSSGVNGGNTYPISVPQYSGMYTLLSVTFNSVATTTATLTLNNTTNSSQFAQPSLSRADNVQDMSNGYLAYMGVPATYSPGYPPTSLGANGSPTDTKVYGPNTIFNSSTMINNFVVSDPSVLGNYEGGGNLSLYYQSVFYVNNVPSGVNSTLNVTDNVALSVTYSFCNTTLASNFVSFTASRQGPSEVRLNWSVVNEEPGGIYYTEVSSNGTDYIDVNSQPSAAMGSSASYNYTYTTLAGASGKLYFRIKQVDRSNSISYSTVSVVSLDNSSTTAFSIFPNPAASGNFISLTLPGDSRSWQIEIFSADGNVVQRNVFNNTSLATVTFNQPMATGTYFVRATNPLSGDMHTGSFLVRK